MSLSHWQTRRLNTAIDLRRLNLSTQLVDLEYDVLDHAVVTNLHYDGIRSDSKAASDLCSRVGIGEQPA